MDATRVLLEEGRSNADPVDQMGWTPLHRCCQEKMPENALGNKKKVEGEEGRHRLSEYTIVARLTFYDLESQNIVD